MLLSWSGFLYLFSFGNNGHVYSEGKTEVPQSKLSSSTIGTSLRHQNEASSSAPATLGKCIIWETMGFTQISGIKIQLLQGMVAVIQ